jgi:PAS domain S-box-containing protein
MRNKVLMENKPIYETAIPQLAKSLTLPSCETQTFTPLRRSRLISLSSVIVNILLLIMAGYGLFMSDASERFPWLIPGFAVLIIVYASLSSFLIYYVNTAFQSSSSRHVMLQKVLDSYQRRTTELQVAATIARDASAETSMADVMKRAVTLINQRFGFYHAAIFLIEQAEDGAYAIMRASAGSDASTKMAEHKYKIPLPSKSVIGYVSSTGQARVSVDVKRDTQYLLNPALAATRSELTVPLRIGDNVIGTLDVQSTEQNAFTQNDVAIMQILADLLATIINEAKLHEQIQDYTQTLEERVAERTLELNREQAQLNAILHAMHEGVIYYEGKKVRYLNSTFTDLTGYEADDWQGIGALLKNSTMTESAAERHLKDIEMMLERKKLWRGEVCLRHKNGAEIDVHMTAVLIQAEEQQGVVMVMRDISQEKALQEQHTRFVAYASHELRTPIANLKTRLYLMNRQREQFDKHYTVVEKVIDQMQRLVEDLLLVSRAERRTLPIKPVVQPLQHIIQNVIEFQLEQASAKHQSLTLQMPEMTVNALVDEDRIMQVVTNLISNAINYTAENGHITVVLEKADEESAEIRVEDTGFGIPPEALSQVFKPFYRANNIEAQGSGLGLHITQQIVELHNGKISVKSELGKGSTFTVRLPLTHGDTQEMAKAE